MLVSTSAIEGAASQMSVAVGEAAVGMLSQLAAASAGTPDNTGGSRSVNVTIYFFDCTLHFKLGSVSITCNACSLEQSLSQSIFK